MTLTDGSQVVARAVERLNKFPVFEPDNYLRQYPEAKRSADAGEYWLRQGRFRGQRPYSMLAAARGVGIAAKRLQNTNLPKRKTDLKAFKGCSVSIYHNSLGNVFMRELAGDLAMSLRRLGANVFFRDENSSPTLGSDFRIVVAPHEFFFLGKGVDWAKPEFLSSTYMLSTEQLQTPWFMNSLPVLLSSAGVIDMFRHSALLLGDAGVPTVFYQPEPPPGLRKLSSDYTLHPLFQAVPKVAREVPIRELSISDRSIDVNLFCSESDRRERILARMASTLAKHNAFIYYRRSRSGSLVNSDSSLTDVAAHVAAHSKITLNIHRDSFGFFEWHRVVKTAMCSGSVIVSEPCFQIPDFVPNVHFFSVEAKQLGEAIDWLLNSNDGIAEAEKVRSAATRLISSAYTGNLAVQNVVSLLQAGDD